MEGTVDAALVDKLRKIQALALDAKNDAESEAAMMAFQRLLSRNGLTASDITEQPATPQSVARKCAYVSLDRIPHWITALHTVISKHFRCFSLFGKFPVNPGLVFVGMPQDVEIAMVTFDCAQKVIERRLEDYMRVGRRAYVHATAAKNSYCTGFVRGLDNAYTMQEDREITTIITTMPDPVRKEQDRYKRHNLRSTGDDPTSIMAGMLDGENFGYGDRLHSPE